MIFGGMIDLAALVIMFFCTSTTMTLVMITVYAFGSGFRTSLMFAALPDIYDYTEYNVGKSLAGTQTAVIGFGSKLASALASAAVSALLVWGAYDSTALDAVLASDGTVQDIAASYPSTVLAIKLAFMGLSIITTVLAIAVLLPYDLDKKYPEIRAALDKRIQENTAGTSK